MINVWQCAKSFVSTYNIGVEKKKKEEVEKNALKNEWYDVAI
jgi:hypothetical protein